MRNSLEDIFTTSILPTSRRHAARWEEWASENGWTYKGREVPELVGRYFPPVESPDREKYFHFVTAVLHGLDVTAFERKIRRKGSSADECDLTMTSHVVVRLPGSPPPALVGMRSRRTLKKLGLSMADYTVEVREGVLVASRSGPHKLRPGRGLHEAAQGLAAQVVSMPASFWHSHHSDA